MKLELPYSPCQILTKIPCQRVYEHNYKLITLLQNAVSNNDKSYAFSTENAFTQDSFRNLWDLLSL